MDSAAGSRSNGERSAPPQRLVSARLQTFVPSPSETGKFDPKRPFASARSKRPPMAVPGGLRRKSRYGAALICSGLLEARMQRPAYFTARSELDMVAGAFGRVPQRQYD
jgi:hypothetical protein